MVSSAQVF